MCCPTVRQKGIKLGDEEEPLQWPPSPWPQSPWPQSAWPQTPTVLKCPKGHALHGRVARELWLRSYRADCGQCGCRISTKDASYSCQECKYSVCISCAQESRRELLITPKAGALSTKLSKDWDLELNDYGEENIEADPGHVMAGDILLCGPDRWGIHHVVLTRGPMERADPDIADRLVKHEPHLAGMDIYECNTIESSRPLKGENFPWYPARSYCAWQRETGTLLLVADIQDGTNTMGINSTRVPMKFLLHPLRTGYGGPKFEPAMFEHALDLCEQESLRWSKATALRAIVNRKTSLDPWDYPDEASRAVLLEDLRKSRLKRPICSSVAINVWQRYFELVSGDDPEGSDQAAQQILRWMPVWSDKTAPSALLKVLTACGWVLSGRLEGL